MGEAAKLSLLCLTEREHGEVLRLASILLLGFLLPHSTGNEFVLLQHAQRRAHVQLQQQLNDKGDAVSGISSFDPVHYVLHMPLEERLENAVRAPLSANESGCDSGDPVLGAAVLTDDSLELALDSFLSNGLSQLLKSRPIHREEVDLLHLIAMAIHPQPNIQAVLPSYFLYLNEHHAQNKYWIRAQSLMHNNMAHQLQIHYRTRLRLIQLIAETNFMVEEYGLHDQSENVVSPLLRGALPHLRASIRAFGEVSARSVVHAHFCHAALTSIACQTRNERILEEEWDYLLHKTVEDPRNYKCTECHQVKDQKRCLAYRRLSILPPENVPFCPHQARAWLLSQFITRSCRSKNDINSEFLGKIASSLTDAIEWQVDSWTKHDGGETERELSKLHATCMLASLLRAATSLIVCLSLSRKKSQSEEDEHSATLTESSIQLLRHHDVGIARAASCLAVTALEVATIDFTPLLFSIIKTILTEDKDLVLLERVVAVASYRSHAFASACLQYLLAKVSTADETKVMEQKVQSLCRWITAICCNCPSVAFRHTNKLMRLLAENSSSNLGQHIVASVLSLRRARYFAGNDLIEDTSILAVLSKTKNEWKKYQLARHALVTGNFSIASAVYKNMLDLPLSEKHFLWISALRHVASAEASLAQHAALGIPDAVIQLRAALWHVTSLENDERASDAGFSFQVRFLKLRLEFLDITTTMRQLVREMRLTGTEPARYTRQLLHLHNVFRAFNCLSSRYGELIQQEGITFQCGRSRSCLLLLRTACRFMALATRNIFADAIPTLVGKSSTMESITSESDEPMASLIRKLDALALSPMDVSVDALVRAAAGLELIDAMLMVPLPFPVDFFSAKPRLFASLAVSPEQDQSGEADTDVVEAYPAVCFSVKCFGQIPEQLLLQSRMPCWTVLLWYQIVYSSPLEDDEAAGRDEDVAETSMPDTVHSPIDLSEYSPASTNLFQDGSFFVTLECPQILLEGQYSMEVKIGCRDVAGYEWEVPLSSGSCTIAIRVSRSR